GGGSRARGTARERAAHERNADGCGDLSRDGRPAKGRDGAEGEGALHAAAPRRHRPRSRTRARARDSAAPACERGRSARALAARARRTMYRLIRELLFRLDAEEAHELTSRQMIALQQIPIALRAIERICRPPASASRTLFGLTFRSPIGIAAGFDKNAVLMPFLAALGFGFVEAGTVTLRPQSGN